MNANMIMLLLVIVSLLLVSVAIVIITYPMFVECGEDYICRWEYFGCDVILRKYVWGMQQCK